MGENRFMAQYCPGCGNPIDPVPIGWAERPLNDDHQAWAILCEQCYKEAYGDG